MAAAYNDEISTLGFTLHLVYTKVEKIYSQ